jgi:hypothetical protein
VINTVGRALSKAFRKRKGSDEPTISDKNNTMNLLLLLVDFTNPSWYAIAWTISLIILLFCLPRLLGIVYIPHTHVGVIEKIWSGKGSLRRARSSHVMAKPVSRRGFYVAAFTLGCTHGNTAFIRNRSSSSAKERWLMFTRATAFRWSRRKRLAVMSTESFSGRD